MADIEILDKRFRNYLLPNGWLTKLYTGTSWAEGPCYFADGDFLVWSDVAGNRMMRYVEGLGVQVFRHPSNYSNGNTRDREGRLITCEHGRRVTRTEHDGSITVLADGYQGKKLNSPNDVVVKSDGTVWFTDPTYGIDSDYEGDKAESELRGSFVFRLEPQAGTLEIVADDFLKPNGLAFSPDESKLYISDTGISHDPENGPHHIRVFDVIDGRKLTNPKVFAEVPDAVADGFRLDTDGNIWTSAGHGVNCYTPAGELLGRIPVPELVSNVVFGAPKRNRLFITATTSLYAIYLNRKGLQRL